MGEYYCVEHKQPDLRIPATALDQFDGGALVWEVTEPAFDLVNIYDGPDALEATMTRLTAGQRALVAIRWYLEEVCNGGFEQFFYNDTGILAMEVLAGFQRIGAAVDADLLARAMAIFPDATPPLDRKERVILLERVSESERESVFEPIEDEFYARTQTYEQYNLCAAYVRAHPEEFVLPA
jgi:hypothetical protein